MLFVLVQKRQRMERPILVDPPSHFHDSNNNCFSSINHTHFWEISKQERQSHRLTHQVTNKPSKQQITMMRMSSSLLLLWTILIVPSRDQLVMSTFLEHTSILPVQLNDDKECPLECQNGGSCKTRAAGSSAMNIRETLHVEEGDHIDDMDDHDQWECVCPPGHAGKLCQLRPREERDLAQTECGSLVCE